MKLVRSLLLLLPLSLVFGQSSDLFDKAPPETDEALRARVMIFFQAHVTGKFKDALTVVAPDAMDDFLAASRDSYKSCEVSKINYSENFTKAKVTTGCKGEYRWHGNHIPVTIPTLSDWKIVDGTWYWYHIHTDSVETPWGISRSTPENTGSPMQMPAIPADPMAAAREIMNKVRIDKTDLELKNSELSKGEVHVTNSMNGSVTVSVDPLPYKGLHFKIDKAELPEGGVATIAFTYDPNDPEILCGSCTTKALLPTLVANVRISPLGRVFPVKLVFALPPDLQKELDKKLPKLPTAAKN